MPTRRRRALTPQVVGDAHGGDDLDTLPPTTRWYRDHGRCTRREKAAKEQYLTPNEEKALAAYVLRMSKHGFPLPVKVLRSLAPIIRQRRTGGATSPALEPRAGFSEIRHLVLAVPRRPPDQAAQGRSHRLCHTFPRSLVVTLSWLACESGSGIWPGQPSASSLVSAGLFKDRKKFRLAK